VRACECDYRFLPIFARRGADVAFVQITKTGSGGRPARESPEGVPREHVLVIRDK
jgi:hypothetical protein